MMSPPPKIERHGEDRRAERRRGRRKRRPPWCAAGRGLRREAHFGGRGREGLVLPDPPVQRAEEQAPTRVPMVGWSRRGIEKSVLNPRWVGSFPSWVSDCGSKFALLNLYDCGWCDGFDWWDTVAWLMMRLGSGLLNLLTYVNLMSGLILYVPVWWPRSSFQDRGTRSWYCMVGVFELKLLKTVGTQLQQKLQILVSSVVRLDILEFHWLFCSWCRAEQNRLGRVDMVKKSCDFLICYLFGSIYTSFFC